MIVLMYDAGVRVGELVAIDVDHLRDGNTALYLPTSIQKDYPTDSSPPPATPTRSFATKAWENR